MVECILRETFSMVGFIINWLVFGVLKHLHTNHNVVYFGLCLYLCTVYKHIVFYTHIVFYINPNIVSICGSRAGLSDHGLGDKASAGSLQRNTGGIFRAKRHKLAHTSNCPRLQSDTSSVNKV